MSTPAEKPEVPRALWITCGVCSLVALIGASWAFLYLADFGSNAFDPQRWRDNPVSTTPLPTKITIRQEMVDALLSGGHLSPGRHRYDIERMLGRPSRYGTPGDGDGPAWGGGTVQRWAYYLGNERGQLGLDSEWLYLDFDSAEKLIVAQLHTD